MTALALPKTVTDLVEEYEQKVEAVDHEIAAFNAAFDRLQMAGCVMGQFVETIGQRSYLYPDSIRKNLLKSGWKAVYERLEIGRVASAKDKQLFERTIADPPPLTVANAKATFGDYLVRPRFHILRGLAEAFCSLDPAYKSHSKVKIGVKGLPKRVVLNGWGSLSSSYARDRFRNMADALAAVRGQPATDWLEILDIDDQHQKGGDAVMNGRQLVRRVIGGEGDAFTAPDRGLTIRTFANGNAHVFFDKEALIAINRGLAEFYGDVLPDAEPEGVKPSASTAVSKDLQYYPTPRAVIDAALNFAGIEGAGAYRSGYTLPEYKVLEPSCGDGRILDVLRERKCNALGFEYHPGRAAEARAKGHSVVTANFLEQEPTPIFDKVVMNPPFYGRHYVKHVEHALKFLKPGGVLVSILPATAHYDHGELKGEWRDLPVGSFAESGTNVPTGMLKVGLKA